MLSTPVTMPTQPRVALNSLSSWKEISAYLGRGIRTVQRWERDLGLPVHRVGKGPRSPVHAFPSELTAWLLRIGNNHREGHGHPLRPQQHPDGTSAVSRVLVQRSSQLVKQMVESLWLQRQRAEELTRLMTQVRQQLPRALSTSTPRNGTVRRHTAARSARRSANGRVRRA
jgi:hypothetical protein